MPRKGGKAIASGSYGCVFRPALKCRGNTDDERHNGVSKLMYQNDANEEMDEMEPILKTVRELPNSEKFFAVNDIDMCEPGHLNDADKESFNNKCSSFISDGINSSNVNKQLSELSIINMPDLGKDMHDYIRDQEPFSVKSFEKFNKMMINLLINGVVPMNQSNVLHHDLKDTNIMVDSNGNTIIIDWGFAGVSSTNSPVPVNVIGRPIQYNTPFSSMLINKKFVSEYKNVCSKLKKQPLTNKQNKSFLKQYFDYHVKRNPGHESYLKQTIAAIFPGENMSNLFLNYNSEVLDQFTSGCNFDMVRFFKEVYIFNVDVWGACTTFIQFLKAPEMMDKLPHDMKTRALAIYKEILLDICFKHGSKIIDVNKIVLLLSKIAGSNSLPAVVTSGHKDVVKKTVFPFPDIPTTSPRGEDSVKIKKTSPTRRRKKRCPNGYRRHPKTKRCTIMSGPNKGNVIDTP
jgi:tRNA A-37 threonylcarbamoyl transferase component Bud32